LLWTLRVVAFRRKVFSGVELIHGDPARGRRSAARPQVIKETGMNSTKTQPFVLGLRGVRYQVKDVQRSISFYTEVLGFNLDLKNLPAFGQVSVGELKLIDR